MAIPSGEWLGLIEREYLTSYIPAGGSAVRFVVAEEVLLPTVQRDLAAMAAAAGLHVVVVDTADAKLNMLHAVFFAIAKSLDWEALTQARLEHLVAEAGYIWPLPGQRLSLSALASANAVAPPLLRRTLQAHVTSTVWRNHGLAQDFRKAMMALLEAALADDKDDLRNGVLDWLRGDLTSLKWVKEAQIGARIGIQNARAMLISLCHWLRSCGAPGLMVLLDVRRLLRDRREIAEGVAYTPAAVMACYEVVRQVIDDTEHFEGFFLAVLADGRLIDDSMPKRGLGAYDALRLRLSNDVRPRDRDNPLAPLVVLAA